MAIAILQGSFQASTAATVRFTRDDSGDVVDWTIDEDTVWNSAQDALAEWSAVIVADGNFGSAFDLTTTNSAGTMKSQVLVTTGGPAFSVAWSHSGDGTALRNWLGESGNIAGGANGSQFSSHLPTGFVAGNGARLVRTSSGRHRAHFVSLDGSHYTQHHASSADADSIGATVTLGWGSTSAATYTGHELLESWLDSLWDDAGSGEPFSLFVTDEGNDIDDCDQYVLRFASPSLHVRPERLASSRPGRQWRVAFDVIQVATAESP